MLYHDECITQDSRFARTNVRIGHVFAMFVWFAVFLAMTGACSHTVATIEPEGLCSERFPYDIAAASPGSPTQDFGAPRGWALSRNLLNNGKLQSESVHDVKMDTNRDGDYNRYGKLSRYEVAYAHDASRGRIWVQILPLPRAEVTARVIGREYISDKETSTSTLLVHTPFVEIVFQRTERTEAEVIVLEEKDLHVDSVPAWQAVVEASLRGDRSDGGTAASSLRRRTRVLVVHPLPTDDVGDRSFWLSPKFVDGQRVKLAMVIGYSNDVDDFDVVSKDFDDFVSRIRYRPHCFVQDPNTTVEEKAKHLNECNEECSAATQHLHISERKTFMNKCADTCESALSGVFLRCLRKTKTTDGPSFKHCFQ